MKKILLTAAIMIFVSLSYSGLNAQTKQSIGKIFDKEFADYAFGKVHFSYLIKKNVIKKIMDDTTDIVAFRVTDEKLAVFNKHRKAIHPANATIGDEEPCYLFSKDKIKELLDKSKTKNIISVEMRGSHVTLSSDEFVLNEAWICPPVCP